MDELHLHLHAIALRTHEARILGPAAAQDRTLPAAREWVRRWGPSLAGAQAPACSCTAGRCAVCN